jgi:hypothetical protein
LKNVNIKILLAFPSIFKQYVCHVPAGNFCRFLSKLSELKTLPNEKVAASKVAKKMKRHYEEPFSLEKNIYLS